MRTPSSEPTTGGTETRVDLAVVGRSVAGIAAALEAARLGARVALVDALGAGSRLSSVDPDLVLDLALAHSRDRGGSDAGGAPFGAREGFRREARLAARRLARRFAARLRRRGVLTLAGRVAFCAPDALWLGEDRRLRFERAIVASGARPRRPAWTRPASRCCLDPHRLFDGDAPVRSALVVGGGEIGCEIALLLARTGARVTLVDRRQRLLRGLDRFLSRALHAALQEAGVEVVLGEPIDAIRADGGAEETHAEIRLASGRIERCDAVVLALGWLAEIEHLGLETIGVRRSQTGALAVDERWATNVRPILAVGAAAASTGDLVAQWTQGLLAARSALGRATPLPGTLPVAIRANPAIASAGLTEEACEKLGVPHDVHVVDGTSPDASGGTRLKLVVSRDGPLLGVHVVGPRADPLARAACRLLDDGVGVAELARGQHPAPPALVRAARAVEEATRAASGSDPTYPVNDAHRSRHGLHE